MARPKRHVYSGAYVFISSKSDYGCALFKSPKDGRYFLSLLENTCRRYHWECYAYCLIQSEYQLCIRLKRATLSEGMRHLNGMYAHYMHQRYPLGGRIFHDRFKSFLVEKSLLAPLIKEIIRLPVTNDLVTQPEYWKWSSHHFLSGKVMSPQWYRQKEVLNFFPNHYQDLHQNYLSYVRRKETSLVWQHVSRQTYLGDEHRILSEMEKTMCDQPEFHKQKDSSFIITELSKLKIQNISKMARNKAIVQLYFSGCVTLETIARHVELHYSTVSRIIKGLEHAQVTSP